VEGSHPVVWCPSHLVPCGREAGTEEAVVLAAGTRAALAPVPSVRGLRSSRSPCHCHAGLMAANGRIPEMVMAMA
jgi:hypothetical protein